MLMVWAVTNLTLQRPEYFFLRPGNAGTELPERSRPRAAALARLENRRAGSHARHLASCDLRFGGASYCIRSGLMPGPDGTMNEYCDGGVASNSPVGIAHAVSKAADVVLLDPPFQPEPTSTMP